MVQPTTNPVWKKLITGEKELRSSNLAINMLLQNCRVRYKLDPSKLDELITHAHGVFVKYEKTLGSELAQLSS